MKPLPQSKNKGQAWKPMIWLLNCIPPPSCCVTSGKCIGLFESQFACVCVCMLSRFNCVQLFANLWTIACQAPLSTGFSRYEYWSEWPLPPPGDLPYLGIARASLTSPALAGGSFTTSATWEAPCLSLLFPDTWIIVIPSQLSECIRIKRMGAP